MREVAMSQVGDEWYIRFPDGRTALAASTAVVRRQLGNGRIPVNVTVRRHPDDEWQSLEWTAEFADLANGSAQHQALPVNGERSERRARTKREPATVASRLNTTQMQTLGIDQVLHELVAALDSTLVQRKLVVALVAGLVLGVMLGFPWVADLTPDGTAEQVTRIVLVVGVWLITAATSVLLTRMTFVEVSRLRPARWREAMIGITPLVLRIAVVQLLAVGGALGFIYLLRHAPPWVQASDQTAPGDLRHLLANWAVALSLILEVGTWPVLGLAMLLAPILTVEECSIWRALRQWIALMQQDLGRAFLYEAFALGIGLIVAAPLAVPLILTANLYTTGDLQLAAIFTRIVLACVALAPVAAYLVVANVFIYLNIRYEAGGRRK